MVLTKDKDGNQEPREQGLATRSRKKVKRDPSYKEDIETFEYVLGPHDKNRDNVKYIQGYTGHWKDPVYIKLMNGRLNHKLKVFVVNMNRTIINISKAYDNNEEPDFITDLKTVVITPLREVRTRIEVFNDSLIHVLSRESIARALSIHNEDVVNIIHYMCITQDFDVCLKYKNETNTVEFELNFDKKEYSFKTISNNHGVI